MHIEPTKYSAVVFDLDGTLLNTLQDIADSVNVTLSLLGFPQHEVGAFRYFVGDGEEKLAWRALPENRRDPAIVKRVLAGFQEQYATRWANNTHPYAGVPELLDALSRDGLRMAILTNKGQVFAEATVSRLLPRWHFDVVLGAHPAIPAKPDPAGARQIARQLGISPALFLYLGDSGVDMKTAVAAGMCPVGALWGYRESRELLAAGARVLLRQPMDLIPLLRAPSTPSALP